MIGRAAIPSQSLSIITLDPKSALVEVANLLFGSGQSVIDRLEVPIEGLLIDTLDAVACLE